MASWRDGIPEDVRNDLETAVAVLQERGAELLDAEGRLAPFGIAVESDDPPNEYVPVTANRGGLRRPQTAIDDLADGLREDRDRWRLVGIAYDVTLEGGRDALCMDVEHRDGHALKVLAPYRRTRMRGRIKFSAGEPSELEPRIWA